MYYGVLDYIAKDVYAQGIALKSLQVQVNSWLTLQNELKSLMMDVTKCSFNLKEKGYEVNHSVPVLFMCVSCRSDLDVV